MAALTLVIDVHREDRTARHRLHGGRWTSRALCEFEALLECRGGGRMLKRVSCDARPKENRVILFDVEAIYLDGWNPDEARRFAESAKIVAPR